MRRSKPRVSRNYSVKSVILCVIILLAPTYARAKDWRGITPLHSTRADVERLLGPPSKDRGGTIFYEFDKEEVSFDFAKGSCKGESDGWNVPRDTVISVWVIPKPNVLKFTDLKLDESMYKREIDKELQYIVRYVNESEGVSYEVDTSADRTVTLIKYYPSAKDGDLRCPVRRKALTNKCKGARRISATISYSSSPPMAQLNATPPPADQKIDFKPSGALDFFDDRGFRGSSQMFKSTDGVWVELIKEWRDSPEEADKALDERLREAGRVVERGPLLDKEGLRLGDRALAYFHAEDGGERPAVLWTDGAAFQHLESPSLRHMLLLEKELFERRPRPKGKATPTGLRPRDGR
jgi:hypothetical protein